jgi:hypothetical protein
MLDGEHGHGLVMKSGQNMAIVEDLSDAQSQLTDWICPGEALHLCDMEAPIHPGQIEVRIRVSW